MSMTSLINLPREMIYSIFEYLHQEHIVYSFFELNHSFSFVVKHFIGEQFQLRIPNEDIIVQYCLSTLLPSIGSNLCSLSISSSYCLSSYIQSIQTHCPNLNRLNIYCCSERDDVRRYVAHLIHPQLVSLTLMFHGEIVGEQISLRLLKKTTDEQVQKLSSASSITLHLSSMNDLILLKRYSESSYLPDGLYMIECSLTGEWFTDSRDDLCTTSEKLHRESIFSIKQLDKEQCSLEYELRTEQTQCPLTVLICHEDEEHWISSSILSTHRKESIRSCSSFTFEKLDDQNQFYIRPCYLRAKRLQLSGKRIIVSLCDKDNTPKHHFRLYRIA